MRVLILISFLAPALAGAADFQVLLDLDNQLATGCNAVTPGGTFGGIEQILSATVTPTGPASANVTALTLETCSGGAFGAPVPVNSPIAPPWPVGVGLGDLGNDVIETYLPTSMLSIPDPQSIRIVVVGSTGPQSQGDSASGILVLAAIAEIPVLDRAGLLLLSVLLIGAAILVLRRGGAAAVAILLLLAGAGAVWAVCLLDGDPSDWSVTDRIVTDPPGDVPPGGDIVSVYAKQDNCGGADSLCFRVDADLVFGLAQTISFTSAAPVGATVGGLAYNVTATATSGLPVTFTIDASAASVCSIIGSQVSFIGVGTCVINANQAGDATYNPAPQVQQSFAVGKGNQTISFTSLAPAAAAVGGPTYDVAASATSGLPVTFAIDAAAASVCSIAGSTVSFIGVGTCVINANQAGDANWNPAPQVQQSFAVGKGNQTISFTSSPPASPQVGGPTYDVTATATSGLAVTFAIDASASTVCSIAGSTVSFIGTGTCVINADQAGDANWNPAPQVQQSFGVGLGNQTISFTSTAPSNAQVGGPTYNVTATATSGLAVTFTIDAAAASVCSVVGSTVSFIGLGTCIINANQAGDANWNPAPQVQQSFAVSKQDQTITFTSTAPVGAVVGGPTYNVTATATSALTVTFAIDASASTVCSIAGSTVSFIGAGTCVINANQAGDATYNAAPQVQQSFAVGQGDQTISFTSSAPVGATVGGPTYNVTATATSGLTVTFTIDASASTVCSIAGSTVSFIGAGTCVINANQAGDANWNPAPQVQQSFAVVKQDQTISFTSTAPINAQVGGPTYNVTATATSGLPVSFTIDAAASTVCSIVGSTVSFIGGGTCIINANQAGNTTYNAAPQVQQSFPVVKQDQTISFTSVAPSNAQVAGPTYNVTATATSGLTVTLTIDASAATVCSIAGSTVSFIGGGTCVINANQAGNGTFNPAPQVQQSFLVVKQDQTITFTSTPPVLATVGGPTYTVTATATSGLAVTFTIDAAASTVCTIAGSTVSFIGGGTCIINANQAGNFAYNPAPQVQQSFAVNSAPVLVASPKETFDTIGNTQLEFKAAQALSPSVFVSGNLVANFTDTDGPAPLSATVVAGGPTTNGGTVSIAANGEFTFTPKAGDTLASDTFGYQITDGAYIVNRTVTVNLVQRVWYVKNNAAAGGLGRSNDPFDTLLEAQTASLANDWIFVYFGDGSTTGQSAGILLKAGQHLIGEFAGLSIPVPVNGGPNPTVLLAAPGATACGGNPCRPFLDDTVAPAVGTPDGVTATNVIPAEIIGLNLAGNVNAIDWTTTAAFAGTGMLAILDNVVRSAAVEGVDINLAGTGATTLGFSLNNITSTGTGLDIQEIGTGALTIASFQSNVVSGNTGGSGMVITNAIFDSTPGGAFDTVPGGNTLIGAAGNGVGGGGMLLTATGDLSFTDLDIFADNGPAFQLIGTGPLNGAAGTRVTVGTGAGIFESINSRAVDVNNATVDLPLSSLKSTNTATKGVSLVSVSDAISPASNAAFSAGGTSTITTTAGATGPIFDVSGGNADISYAGTIVNSGTAARAVSLATWNGDDATDDITFSGAITENGAGILVNANAGTRPITFSGGMTINTSTGEGFAATNNTTTGGLHITGTNTINSTSATALRVTSTTIGSSNITFQSISSGNATAAADPANGIVLDTTGATGHLSVTGTAAALSGGTIQNQTGHCVLLNSTRDVSLNKVNILNCAFSGVDGSAVTNFTFTNGSIDNVGTGAPGQYSESNIGFNDSGAFTSTSVSGVVTITGNTLTNARRHGIQIENGTGTISNLVITGNTLTSSTNAAVSLGSGILVLQQGSAATTSHLTTGNVSNNTVTNFPSLEGIAILGGSGNTANNTSSTLGANGTPVVISGNTIRGQAAAAQHMGSNAIRASMNSQVGVMNVTISGNGTVANPITNIQGQGISVFAGGTITGTTTITNNVIVANQTLGAGTQGLAVQVDDGPAGLGTSAADYNVTISNNNVSAYEGFGIRAIARASLAKLDVTIQNNTVGAPSLLNRNGIRIDSGSALGDTTLCLLMSGNTSAGSGVNKGMALRKQGSVAGTNEFGISGLGGPATFTPTVENKINADNPAGNGVDNISGDNFLSCTITP